jgi:hypothetical protein
MRKRLQAYKETIEASLAGLLFFRGLMISIVDRCSKLNGSLPLLPSKCNTRHKVSSIFAVKHC